MTGAPLKLIGHLLMEQPTLPPMPWPYGYVVAANGVFVWAKREGLEGRRLVLQAALARLEDIRRHDVSGFAEIYNDLEQHYRHRLASVGDQGDEQHEEQAVHYSRYLDVSRTLLEVERQAALRLRADGRITDEALREMENEMDLNETRLITARNQHA